MEHDSQNLLSNTVPTGTDPAHVTSLQSPADARPQEVNGKPQRVILVAVDDSEASEMACQWAIDNLVRPGDKLHLTHVAQLPHTVGLGGTICVGPPVIFSEETEDRKVRATIKTAKEFLLKRFEPRLKDIEHKMEIVHYSKGATAIGELICDHAKNMPAAAVVMASHDKGAVKRLFLGSTTDYCTRHCPVSLVITR